MKIYSVGGSAAARAAFVEKLSRSIMFPRPAQSPPPPVQAITADEAKAALGPEWEEPGAHVGSGGTADVLPSLV